MAMMFYVVVTPLGLVARLMGKDLLEFHLHRSATTYWIERHPPGPVPDIKKNQF